MFSSSIQKVGGTAEEPDYVYYNADIVNNTTANTFNGVAIADPQIRFNETRDTAIIKNAADYYFSIIRFTMDGANKDLPLFIPVIQEGTGQTNVNLTVYSMAVGFQQTFTDNAATQYVITARPTPRYIEYVPETSNPVAAPTPRTMANNQFQGVYDNTIGYQLGQIVTLGGLVITTGSYTGPFYQPITPQAWNGRANYPAGSAVQYNGQFYFNSVAVPPPVFSAPQNPTPDLGGSWVAGTPTSGSPFLLYPDISPYWVLAGENQGQPQDLTSRYYWVYTFQHWVDLWNKTMFDPTQLGAAPTAQSTCAYQDTYNQFYAEWSTSTLYSAGFTFPYATFGDFVNAVYPPVMIFDPATFKFIIQADSNGFGERLTSWTPVAPANPVVGQPTPPNARLFFNANMYGLFGNYDNTYWNDLAADPTFSPYPSLSVPDGYVNEILFTNKFYRNVADYRLPPYAGAPPLGYVPAALQRVYWLAEQDYSSVDSLWSPVSSIVFTSTLLPVKSEATGAPVVLGTGNIGQSSATVQSAFQPIITDISLDTSQLGGTAAYRQFIYYAPSAEYRLSDFSTSKQDIRNIDIQVYWKNRLDNQLYPINMFNLSSVAIKVMFKRKDAQGGKA